MLYMQSLRRERSSVRQNIGSAAPTPLHQTERQNVASKQPHAFDLAANRVGTRSASARGYCSSRSAGSSEARAAGRSANGAAQKSRERRILGASGTRRNL